jgi:hypothetical protein
MKSPGVRSVDVIELVAQRGRGGTRARVYRVPTTAPSNNRCERDRTASVEVLQFRDREIPQLLNDPTRPAGGRLNIVFCETADATL